MLNKGGNACIVSVAKVIDGLWRRYLVVFSVDPYCDGTELSQGSKALVSNP